MPAAKAAPSRLPHLYIFGGLVAFFFSFLITVEKIALLANPGHIPPCSINPLISCSSVMQSWQASLFGFPNPLLGIAGFAIVATVGFAMLSGFKPKKWFWACLQVGIGLATVFVYWLFFQAVFSIGALCLYCMAVWAMTLPIFAYTVDHGLREWGILLKRRTVTVALLLMYGIILGAILWRFWFYWVGLFRWATV